MTVSSRLLAPALAGALLVSVFVAAPASAASPSVSTLAELQNALADCTTAPNTITLTADIADPGAELATACDTTLDLGAFDLTVRNIVIGGGTEFEVTGPTDGSSGTLTVNASGFSYISGVQTTNATFRVTGAAVHATGGHHGGVIGGQGDAGTLIVEAGEVRAISTSVYGTAIGGGFTSGDGGIVAITGGSVYAATSSGYGTAIGGGHGGVFEDGGDGADITVTGGTLTAVTSGTYATAIGGAGTIADASHRSGNGGSLAIGPSGTVSISSQYNAFGLGYDFGSDAAAGKFGSVQVDGTLYLPNGSWNIVGDPGIGAEVTIGATGRILGDSAAPATGAAISGSGTIDNQGTVALNPSNTVNGNNRTVTFDTADPSVRVLAPSFDTGYRTLPAPPAGKQWNTASDGMGQWFTGTSSTSGTGTTPLYAVAPGSLRVSSDPVDLTATAGEPYVFPVDVIGPDGIVLGTQPVIDYSSTDCDIVGGNVFEVAGECNIMASTTVQGIALTASFTIDVVAGPVAVMALTPATATVAQGGSLTFTITGEDASGNPADTSGATLSSSVASDEIAGRTVKFVHASPHTITATLGGVTAQARVEVTPTPTLAPKPNSASALPSTGGDFGWGQGIVAALLLAVGASVLTVSARRRNGNG